MPKKMLFISALLLLTACSENEPVQEAAVANESAVEAPGMSDFNPKDSQQEQQDKAEARGAAQANAAIQGDEAAEERRKDDAPR